MDHKKAEWTIKKAECQRIDAFQLRCWRRLLEVPWIGRRSNQSILKEINPEYALDGLMLKLKLQYFGHLMWRGDLLEKTLMPGKIEGRRRRARQRTRWLHGITDSMNRVWGNSGRWWRTGKPGLLQSVGSQRAGHNWANEQQGIVRFANFGNSALRECTYVGGYERYHIKLLIDLVPIFQKVVG